MSDTPQLVPCETVRVETRASNSRFLTTLARAGTVAEARAFIQSIRDEMPDANHHVFAFRIGHGSSVTEGMSDDGEPSGTSGPPALAVLRGSGLGDAVLVITRYFGGTKLGTGGLVRAYGDAVKAVLEKLPLAEKVPTHTVMMAVPYPLYEQVKLLVEAKNGLVLDEEFAADVTITAQFAVEQFDDFQNALRELSHGRLQAEIIETNPQTIMPLGSFAGDSQL